MTNYCRLLPGRDDYRRSRSGRCCDRRAAAGPTLDEERLAVLLFKDLRVSAAFRLSTTAMVNVTRGLGRTAG